MSPREREIKLAASPTFALPSLRDRASGLHAGAPELAVLDATYFDTEDLRLTRAGATLRHRSDEGWLVKLPSVRDEAGDDRDDEDVLSREEHHFAGASWAPPAAALDVLQALTRGAPVAAVARLRTVRRRVQVTDLTGALVAEVADDEVTAQVDPSVDQADGPPHRPGPALEHPSFRQLEIELADGSTRAQRRAILTALADAGAGSPDPTTKLAYALGVRASAPPDVVVAPLAEPTVDAVLRYALSSSVAQLLAHDPGIRLDGDSEEVHQARVATRRLRSHLRTFRSLVDAPWAEQLRDELGWLADVLGGVRDREVLLERLVARTHELRDADRLAAKRLLDELRDDRMRRRDLLLAALRSDRYLTLLDRLVAAARHPRLLLRVDDEDDLEVLRGLVWSPTRRLLKALKDLSPDSPDAALHATRILAKRARYAAEAVQPAFGKPARALARAVADLQGVLGEHQDAVLAAEWLRRHAEHAGEDEAFVAGQLAGLEHQAAERARSAWPKLAARASAKSLRSWL